MTTLLVDIGPKMLLWMYAIADWRFGFGVFLGAQGWA
jgi:hypothetical protein